MWPIVLGVSLLLTGLLLANQRDGFTDTLDTSTVNATLLVKRAFDDATSLLGIIAGAGGIDKIKDKAQTEYEKTLVDTAIRYVQNFLKYVPSSPTVATLEVFKKDEVDIILVSNTVISYVNLINNMMKRSSEDGDRLYRTYTDSLALYAACKTVLAQNTALKQTEEPLKSILASLETALVSEKEDTLRKLKVYDLGLTAAQKADIAVKMFEINQKVIVLYYLVKTNGDLFPNMKLMDIIKTANTVPAAAFTDYKREGFATIGSPYNNPLRKRPSPFFRLGK
jgi:hypothetical protein